MICIYCQGFSIKKGKETAIQKYQCKTCRKYFRSNYCNRKYTLEDEKNIACLTKEGMGISSISRYLRIPKTSVQRRLEVYASKIVTPVFHEDLQVYEVDEVKTFVQNKENECWLAYALNHKTAVVVAIAIGRRTIETIKPLITKIKLLNPKRIFTDGLNIYESQIEKPLHALGKYLTWRIERNHLTLRDRLKRLSRATLCFSKSIRLLFCCVKIFLWG